MMEVSPWLVFPAFFLWLGVLMLPWRPWATDESLDASEPIDEDLGDVTVLIPARNESTHIQDTLRAVDRQGRNHQIILIDDQSDDGTAEAAQALQLQNLTIVKGCPLSPGWTGKLWALEQGWQQVQTPLTLLLDADIALQPGILSTLRARMKADGLQLISLMAHLRMTSFWEKLLMPTFVYFFKLIYPFGLSNRPDFRWVAAAAGGCILIETRVLQEMNGFSAIKDALIDDCSLARTVKSRGGKTWIGLTHSVVSLRPYQSLDAIWNMVARTAFTQLHYSFVLLALCTATMLLGYFIPLIGVFMPSFRTEVEVLSGMTLAMMMTSYFPTLRYYRLSWAWTISLPIVGLLFLAMTWSSAIRFLQGSRSSWKGRVYSMDLK
jgi:hopene-associated glycosyltransferase HpnB